ncbi:TPA: hypothetical protein IBW92_003333 [Escherichia coli]|nr:hypothetical protein [Escherichia coli]
MTIDYQVLREAAEKATPDEWVAFISTDTGTYAVHTPGDERCEDVIKWTGFDGQKNAENINDCYDHWMIWAQIAHADVTNIRIEELKEHQAA